MNIKESPRLIDRYADEPLRQQVKFYYSHPDFKDDCLYACGVFAYSKKLQNDFQLMRDWFYHNARYSIMDQISLPFLLWRNHTSISLITENIYSNQYFEYCGHRIKKWHYSNIALRIKKSVVRRLFPQSTA